MKKVLFLWTLRGLIKNLNKINIIDPKTKTGDLYVMLAKGLINKKIVDEVELAWIDPNLKKKSFFILPKIKILVFPSVEEAIKSLKGNDYEYLFVRGNYKEFKNITDSFSADYKMFYAADPEYWPNFWPKNYFDLMFVDEKTQINAGKKIYPNSTIALLDKPVDTKIFKPKKTKKIYDVCCIGNFIFWKNHQLLFSTLDKIANSHKIKLACVGKTFGKDSEIGIAAWKNHVNLAFLGPQDAKGVARIINQSKIGVIVSEKDANPRTLGETLACDVPVIVNSNLVGGKRLINSKTGIISKPQDLPQKISWMLKNYKKFNPAKSFNQNMKLDQVIDRCFTKYLK